MMMKELVMKNRSYRRFDQGASVSRETLIELVELARLSATASNIQPLRFLLSADASRNALIFPHLA
jgi:nitroreductase